MSQPQRLLECCSCLLGVASDCDMCFSRCIIKWCYLMTEGFVCGMVCQINELTERTM